MGLIALLGAREGAREHTADGRPGPLMGFGGQPLVEFQARAAIRAGAERILILADAATADLGQLVDRLVAATGVEVALVRDMIALARSLAPDDRLLLVSDNMVVPLDALVTLAASDAPALLSVADVPATSAFERIDADTKWAGVLLMPGAHVLATLDMLGDWDLALTLLRRAVQDGAHRVALSPDLVMDGHLAIVRDAASAHLALRARAEEDRREAVSAAGPVGRLLAPFSRLIVQELVRREVEPGWLHGVALACAAFGVILALGGFAGLALLVLIFAGALDDLARQSERVTLRVSGMPWRSWLVSGGGLLALAIIGWRLAGGGALALAGAWLPLVLVGLLAWRQAGSAPGGLWRGWTAMTVPLALIIALVGVLASAADVALALLGLLATVMVALRFVLDGASKV